MRLGYYFIGQRNVLADFFRNRRTRRLGFGRISYGRGFYTYYRF